MYVNEIRTEVGKALEAVKQFPPENNIENAGKMMLPENVNILNKTEEEPRNLTEREGLDAIEKEKDINMSSETENEESRKVYAYTHCFANTSNYRRRYGAEALSKRFKKSTA